MKKVNIIKLVKTYMVPIILVLICTVFSLLDDKFFKASNLISILRQISMLGITSIGCACVMLLGENDLACGVMQGFAGVICAIIMRDTGIPTWLCFIITLVVCSLIGFLDGLLIVKTNIPSMISSLGVRNIIYGLGFIISGGLPIYNIRDDAKYLGQGKIFEIPVPVILLVVFFIIGYFLLNKTYIGRHLFAVGSNAEAAKLSGINVDKVKIFAMTFSAFCASFAGLILMGRNASGQPKAGDGGEMNAITACVVGGVSALGGTCDPLNLMVGVMVMGVLTNGLTICGVSEFWQVVCKGVVLIVSVGFDSYEKTKASKVRIESLEDKPAEVKA